MNKAGTILSLFLFIRISALFCQNPTALREAGPGPNLFVKDKDIFGVRVFIENKGQFKGDSSIKDPILFGYDDGYEKIYFTRRGLIYEMNKTYPVKLSQIEAIEHGEDGKIKPTENYFIHMNWVGANPEPIIEAGEQQQHYFTYGGPEFNAHTFKKITYRNVYDNIDVEYIIPNDHATGIKYSVILHPGAELKAFKAFYHGDVRKIQLKKSKVVVKTPMEDITEYPPLTYYKNGESVESGFTLNEDTLGFELPENYDKNRTLVIDPWVVGISTLASHNYAFDVDYDFGGNTYIYGGNSPFKVAFYNAAGSLQWTFGGVVITPSWSGITWPSNFGVDRLLSKTYVGQGWVTNPGVSVVRLNALGNYDNLMTTPNLSYNEIWDFGFHCQTADVFILGGGTSSNITAATINSVTSALNLATFNPTIPNTNQDIVSHAIDDQGNIFVIYTGPPSVTNKISAINSTFNGNFYLQPSTFNTFAEFSNKIQYQGIVAGNSNGFNCLAVNANYLYYWDGFNLAAYSKPTGTLVASTTLNSYTARRQGGIAVDDCNNVYFGGDGVIHCYNFNGSNFTSLNSIPLNVGSVNQYVYDIRLNRSTKTLYVCGSGFVGTYSAVASMSCNAVISLCAFNQAGVAASSTSITCATLGSATVTANAGIGPFSYTWIPSGQTSSVATGLIPGTYTIVVYDAGSLSTYTTTTSFVSAIPLTGTISNTFMLACNGVYDGTAAVIALSGGSGSQSYLWNNGTSTHSNSSASGMASGNWSLTVTDALTGCIYNPTFTIHAPSLLVSFISISSPSSCAGDGQVLYGGSAGGAPPYTYNWISGPASSSMQVLESTAGIFNYSLVTTDANGCLDTAYASINYISNPTLSISNVSICPGKTGTLTVSGASTYTWFSTSAPLSGSSTFTDSPLTNSNYTVVGSALGCSAVTTASIILLPEPIPVFSSNSPRCQGDNILFSVSAGTSAVWNGVGGYFSSSLTNTLSLCQPTQSGIYQVTVTAANSCTAAVQGTLTIHSTPTLIASGSSVCVNQLIQLSANASQASNFIWTGPNFVSLSQNPAIANPAVNASGNYTVTITSAQNCTNSAIAHVTVIPMPVINFSSNSPLCVGSTLSFNASMTSGALNYLWSGPNGFNAVIQNPVISNITVPASGEYTLTTITGPCTISASQSATIYPLPVVQAFNNGPVCEGKPFQIGVNNSGVSYLWTGPNSYSSIQQNPGFSYAQLNHSGNYTVLVTDGNSCQSTDITSVTILSNPVVHAFGDLVCFGEPAQLQATGADNYSWTGPLGFQATGNNPQVVAALNQQVWSYTVLGTALNGCTTIATTTIGTRPLPVPSMTITDRVCIKSTVYLRGEGGLSYVWSGPLNFYSTEQNTSFYVSNTGMAGQYSLMVMDIHGCKGYTRNPLQVDPEPSANLKGRLTGCLPFCSEYSLETVNSQSLQNVSWSLDGNITNQAVLNYCFNQSGNFKIFAEFESERQCKGNLLQYVEVFPLPLADFYYSPLKPVENQDLVTFTSNSVGENLSGWNWYFNDGKNIDEQGIDISRLFEDAGTYVVVLQVRNSWDCMDTIIKTIEVMTDFNVFIPNAFTPNEDGINDTFFPVMRGVKQFEMQVFDRWGAMVFGTNSIEKVWDGTYKGFECKQDVYNYKMVLLNNKGEEKEYIGSVTLYR